ncbi:hypothetical protein UFOVP410_27 [uncultured Caudovirales phage]|uniref:Uncharacterized protein n=1 Tax=uncultured Caudovirales phage TaxID=2100421 RepID=A0A6J5M3I8_9CAUD|nr:hypothetical protein UFOVP410_27 [uncultured Caudovirales phage]
MRSLVKKNPKVQKSIKSKITAPDYIVKNGFTYEKMSSCSVDVELELRLDILQALDKLVSDGKFVSRGDAIRSILRQKIESLDKE